MGRDMVVGPIVPHGPTLRRVEKEKTNTGWESSPEQRTTGSETDALLGVVVTLGVRYRKPDQFTK